MTVTVLPEYDPGIKLVDAWEWKKTWEGRHCSQSPPKRIAPSRFIRPTPLLWTTAAAQLPGKALHVGQALWYVSGLKREKTVKISSRILKLFGVSRHAYARCLTLMEEAGLVRVEKRSGKTPLVTIIADGEILSPSQGKSGETLDSI